MSLISKTTVLVSAKCSVEIKSNTNKTNIFFLKRTAKHAYCTQAVKLTKQP